MIAILAIMIITMTMIITVTSKFYLIMIVRAKITNSELLP